MKRLTWMMTHWCQNQCSYCGVPVMKQRKEVWASGRHAFAKHGWETWLGAFLVLMEKYPLYLKITGGEPFLDQVNFLPLLRGLLQSPRTLAIRVDTTGFFSPKPYLGLPLDKILLNVSYHPQTIKFPDFIRKISALREAGFKVCMVNYVLSPENLLVFDESMAELDKQGFFVNVCPMMPDGDYLGRTVRGERELDLINQYNHPLDTKYRTLNPATQGKACWHPSKSLFLDYEGQLSVQCLKGTTDFLAGEIPKLPTGAVPCPHDKCIGCLEMYRELEGEDYQRQTGIFTLEEYVAEVQKYRSLAQST